MSTYDRHELKIIRRGISVDKVITAYKHFGSLRKAAAVCKVSKDTVRNVLRRFHIAAPIASLPAKASYNPRNAYSVFAKWHKAHANDMGLPYSRSALAALAGVTPNTVKCYFQRRRAAARKILLSLPDLRDLELTLEDLEGKVFRTHELELYRYAIDRYSQRAALQGKLEYAGEVNVLIPSIELFARRVRKAPTLALSSQVEPKLQSR
jgi:hypothetical protein